MLDRIKKLFEPKFTLENTVEPLNRINASRKNAYIKEFYLWYPEVCIPSDLTGKNWADILTKTYTYTQPHDHFPGIMLMSGLARHVPRIDSDPTVKKFITAEFGSVHSLCRELRPGGAFQAIDDKMVSPYTIIPAGSPYNNGRPIGISALTPLVAQLFFVSDNKLAQQVDPLMYIGFVIKAVPELPQPMQEYARRNNIKLR